MICKAKIVTKNYRTRLFLNDNEIASVAGIDLAIHVGEVPTLTLEVSPTEIEVEVDGVILERSDSVQNNSLYLTGDVPTILKGLAKDSKED